MPETAPYHIILTRRVTDEEQVSVELSFDDEDVAAKAVERFYNQMHAFRDAHNAKVLALQEGKIAEIQRRTELAGEACRRAEAERDAILLELSDAKKRRDRKIGPAPAFPRENGSPAA